MTGRGLTEKPPMELIKMYVARGGVSVSSLTQWGKDEFSSFTSDWLPHYLTWKGVDGKRQTLLGDHTAFFAKIYSASPSTADSSNVIVLNKGYKEEDIGKLIDTKGTEIKRYDLRKFWSDTWRHAIHWTYFDADRGNYSIYSVEIDAKKYAGFRTSSVFHMQGSKKPVRSPAPSTNG
jgi:hypothetical protein